MGVQKKAVVSDNQLSDGSHYHNRRDHSGINGRLFGRYGYGGAWSGGYDSFQRTSGKKINLFIYSLGLVNFKSWRVFFKCLFLWVADCVSKLTCKSILVNNLLAKQNAVKSFKISGVIYNDLWIQVDFLKDVNVTGVVTQGRPVSDDDQWVTSYLIKYLEDGQNNFVTVKDKNNQPMVYLYFFKF